MKRNLSFTILIGVSLLAPQAMANEVAPTTGGAASAPAKGADVALTSTAPQSLVNGISGYQIPKISGGQGGSYCSADFSKTVAKASGKTAKEITHTPEQIIKGARAAGANENLVKKVLATFLANKGKIANQDVVSFADYSLPVSKKRFFMIDLRKGTTTAYRVAHGKGSDPNHTGRLQSFSNVNNSHASSEGCNLTGSTYFGSNGPSLNLHGFESTNNNNCARRVVMHSKWYMNGSNGGRSWGCPVFSDGDRNIILQKIQSGSITCSFRGDGKSSPVKSDAISKVSKTAKKKSVRTSRSRRSRA